MGGAPRGSGTAHFYVHGQFQDYPPGYLYLLWLTGKVSAAPGYLLLKLPAVLADLGLAWVAGTFATRIAPARLTRRWPVRTLVTASVLFNPATFGLSAILGPGGLGTGAVVLGALLLLFTGERSPARDAAAFLLFAIAFAMKPQVGVVLPVMLYALYRRYLYRRARAERLEGALTIAAVGAPPSFSGRAQASRSASGRWTSLASTDTPPRSTP